MEHSSAILGLLAETSLHAGSGQSAGVIDLPIQREAHTDWPVVFGSAVKGALRARAEEGHEKPSWIKDVFGPETANASEYAGALLVSDARLLLLPVRSLTSHFKWVTCPALLRRFAADARRLGLPALSSKALPDILDSEQALICAGEPGPLFLEEFRFTTAVAELGPVIRAIAPLMGRDDAEAALRRQLVVVSDDLFCHLSRYATPVNPHVCLDNQTKTVKTGALWYEESLPPDTLLYTCLVAQRSRVRNSAKGAGEVLAHVARDLFEDRPYLQLGGNETVGMGWCQVRVWQEEA